MAEIKIYVGAVADFSQNDKLPDYALKSLEKLKIENRIKEKRAGYGLLDYAFKQSNLDADVTKCFLNETGKPMHKDFYFSISHSSEIVAIAISSAPLGIDIEPCGNEKRTDRLKEKIIHKNEKCGNTLALWTVKEAIFKFSGKDKTFIPSSINTTKFNSKTFRFFWENKEFIMSVVADDLSEVNFNNIKPTNIH